MSRSHRSQKESVTASRRIKRDADGSPQLPRIIERRPAHGDIHPIPKRMLQRVLQLVPVEYVHGLSRIELRARNSSEIGLPFGCYWVRERAIILYSLPLAFQCDYLSAGFRRSLERFHAIIEPHDKGFKVAWPMTIRMSRWFYSFVFAHELGHHFIEQYKTKNGRVRSLNKEEIVADLHSERFTVELFARTRKQQATGLSNVHLQAKKG